MRVVFEFALSLPIFLFCACWWRALFYSEKSRFTTLRKKRLSLRLDSVFVEFGEC
jgi:hypothetical protein